MPQPVQIVCMGYETWFGSVDGAHCTPFTGTVIEQAVRVREGAGVRGALPVPTWEEIVACAQYRDRAIYTSEVRQLALFMAREGVMQHLRSPETLLATRVRFLTDLDRIIALVESRTDEMQVLEQASVHPDPLPDSVDIPVSRCTDPVVAAGLEEIERLKKLRRICADEISRLAGKVLPNCSMLCGNLVAARLMTAAGGLSNLSRLPSATIQVLGAGPALFAHIRGGAPPPKHGIIYEHKRVHAAPKKARGRISRALAARVAIAARIDYYRGVEDPGFLSRSDEIIRQRTARR